MVCTSAIITALLSPLLSLSLRSTRHTSSFQRRSVQHSGRRLDSDLRLLFCIHTTRHVPSLLALLDSSNPSKRHPISLLVLHLIELSSRPSSMLIIHSSSSSAATSAISRSFKSYEDQSSGSLTVRTLTAVSPYATMHHDISSTAEDFRAALIILPFHKHRTVDGGMELTNPYLRHLNQSVLTSAPCSVAILIDRGLQAPSRLAASRSAALFFLSGPDDREALAIASRIASHHHYSLTVLRVIGPNSFEEESSLADDECVTEFRLRYVSDESVIYAEAEAATAEDTLAALKSLLNGRHDLYIVGKGSGAGSPLTAGLTDWSECPELGPIGDLLASPDFGIPVSSVLVVQQCLPALMGETGLERKAMDVSSSGMGRGRFATMATAEKVTYRTRSMASRRT